MNAPPPTRWSAILHQLEDALLRGAADPDTQAWVNHVAAQLDITLSIDSSAALLELNVLITRLAQGESTVFGQASAEAPPYTRAWSDGQLGAVRELLTRDAYWSLREIAALVRLRGWMLPEVSLRSLLDSLCRYPYLFLDVADLCGDHIRWAARQDPAAEWLFPTGTPDRWQYPPKHMPAALFHWIVQCPEEALSWLNDNASSFTDTVWSELRTHYGHLLPDEVGIGKPGASIPSRSTLPCRVSEAPLDPDTLLDWFRQQLTENASPMGEVEESLISLVPRDQLCALLQEHLHTIRYQLAPGSYAGRLLCSERLFWTEELTRDVLRCFQYRPTLAKETRTDTAIFKAIVWRGQLSFLVRQLQSTPSLPDFPLSLQKEAPLIRELLLSRYNLYKAFQP